MVDVGQESAVKSENSPDWRNYVPALPLAPKGRVFEFSCKRQKNYPQRIRHDALECNHFRRRFERKRDGNPRRAGRALPHLLAADLFFYHAARLLTRGRRGSDAGLLCEDT